MIGKQILAPGETLDVFNPFSEFESPVPLTELQYSFCLLRGDDLKRTDIEVQADSLVQLYEVTQVLTEQLDGDIKRLG